VATKSVDYKIGLHFVEKTEETMFKEHVVDNMPKENGEKWLAVQEYIENNVMKVFVENSRSSRE